MYNVSIVTLFPEMFPGALSHSIPGRALEKNIWNLNVIDMREFGLGKHKTVDDTCFGGGAGMLIRPDVVHNALLKALTFHVSSPRIVYLSPKGTPLKQSMVKDIANSSGMVLLCGRYEGVDQRVLDFWAQHHALEEISMGDYVLSGGELPAMTLVDACVRLLPGALGKEESFQNESFEMDLLEFPQYTKPKIWSVSHMGKETNMDVPDILFSGHHKNIDVWRYEKAFELTKKRRPDLFNKIPCE
jgi:tRNA (guanine37-N1)-methyltransferase